MESDKDQTLASGSQVTPQISQGNPGEGTMSHDLSATADIQALFDTSVSRSISQAMVSAMGAVSTSQSHSITQAILQVHQSAQQTGTSTASSVTTAPQGRKATAKTKHSSKTALSDSLTSVSDGAQPPPRKIATSRAKSARLWKRARAQLDLSESELSDFKEEMDESDKDDLEGQSKSDSDSALGEDSASSLGTFPDYRSSGGTSFQPC
ncbi:Hypothetical predicted protein [Pelobates cultripes]|uniref:Uncharacterized protein n=1 Tax=Pelobates cultripes TaxID=61616 RepID=A0AAD1T137_PELCU|nr:Hypothetical predicted protein [Pelobates cultripes]